MADFEFTWRFMDFEIRTARPFSGAGPYLELVKWYDYDGRRHCYTLAYWHRDKDGGYELHFVRERPLADIAEEDISPIWKQLFLAQQMFEDAELKAGEED